MRIYKIIFLLLILSLSSVPASAGLAWYTLNDWTMKLDNNKVYIYGLDLPSICSAGGAPDVNDRGEINVATSDYNRALFSFALTAYKSGVTSIKVVVDNTVSPCVISGIEEN